MTARLALRAKSPSTFLVVESTAITTPEWTGFSVAVDDATPIFLLVHPAHPRRGRDLTTEKLERKPSPLLAHLRARLRHFAA